MNIMEAIGTGCLYLALAAAIGAAGILGVQVLAWAWYRWDGGRKGLIAWLRGI